MVCTMRSGSRLLLLFLAAFSYAGCDFIADLIGDTVNREKTWQRLLELENCPTPSLLDSTIIQVNESLSAGAEFVSSPDVSSRYECDFECCQTSVNKEKDKKCNVAVYSTDTKRCYLFNCGNPSKCRFDDHSGYSASLLNPLHNVKPDRLPIVTTEEPVRTILVTAAPSKPLNLHLLDGCRPDVDVCVDTLSYCAANGFCMCKDSYHPKNGLCRKDCHKQLEFECTNANRKYSGPDCVAIYDVCDGIPQCPDGSDERKCETENMKAAVPSPDKKDEVEVKLDSDAKASVEKTTSKMATTTTNQSNAATTITSTAVDQATTTETIIEKKMAGPFGSSNAAIIALSLSLTLTVLLILYLGCRYRNMRSRLVHQRRGIKGDEADYLIDGMYL